jgi:hypothetical protein
MTFTIETYPDKGEIVGSGRAYFSREYTTGANIAATASSAENYISEADEYANGPFDVVLISNRDSVDMALNLDRYTGNRIIIPAGMTIGAKGLQFRNFSLTNLDPANAHTAGKITILVQNTRTPRRA